MECLGCKHSVMISRAKFEKAMKRVVEPAAE